MKNINVTQADLPFWNLQGKNQITTHFNKGAYFVDFPNEINYKTIVDQY